MVRPPPINRGCAVARIDITFGRPELRSVQAAAGTDDVAALDRALTAGLMDAADWSDRIDVAARTVESRFRDRVPVALDQWAHSAWDSPAASLLRGAVEARRAWQIRGEGMKWRRPAEVRQALSTAEHWLRAAARLRPDDATPWVWLASIGRLQGVTPAETMNRQAELAKRAPHYFTGHYQALGSLSPAWGYPAEL